MPLLSWLTLISTAFIFIAGGLGLLIFLIFFFNDDASPGLGILVSLLFFSLASVFSTNLSEAAIWQAALIAGCVLFLILGLAIHFFLPNFDNSDLVKAIRPIIFFCLASGLLIAVVSVTKIVLAG
jgi:hypothetical protein